ncbi:MAG: GYD domain-containing protein [Chloroflexi bacterium]|nr:GYD domain-containing protein [Chloroflexota bacterium]MCI0783034.1 GYD domain-containing protein [Chloroflexota bacterium]MCI0814784.1 GYD domain-containing protein [Chloroflexota bacterium]MCI0816905.1 GYD domain-containing protein [Chloroflexota bacterium]MCI0818768.1 GYD domain-containing protein [Chloroflexota bacterium]
MPRYIILYKFTDQGLKNIKDTVGRAAEVRKANESRGFKIIGTYWTQGPYDVVAIVESPDEESMLAGLFNIAETGNVHSTTMRAFDEWEMGSALAKG